MIIFVNVDKIKNLKGRDRHFLPNSHCVGCFYVVIIIFTPSPISWKDTVRLHSKCSTCCLFVLFKRSEQRSCRIAGNLENHPSYNRWWISLLLSILLHRKQQRHPSLMSVLFCFCNHLCTWCVHAEWSRLRFMRIMMKWKDSTFSVLKGLIRINTSISYADVNSWDLSKVYLYLLMLSI